MIKKLMFGLLSVALFSCQPGEESKTAKEATSGPAANAVMEDITVEIASSMEGMGDVVFLDVRSEDEYSSGHIKNSVNLDVLKKNFTNEVGKLDRDKTYVVYCHSGRRSAKSALIMKDLGFVSVYNVLGGMVAWESNGFDVEK